MPRTSCLCFKVITGPAPFLLFKQLQVCTSLTLWSSYDTGLLAMNHDKQNMVSAIRPHIWNYYCHRISDTVEVYTLSSKVWKLTSSLSTIVEVRFQSSGWMDEGVCICSRMCVWCMGSVCTCVCNTSCSEQLVFRYFVALFLVETVTKKCLYRLIILMFCFGGQSVWLVRHPFSHPVHFLSSLISHKWVLWTLCPMIHSICRTQVRLLKTLSCISHSFCLTQVRVL